MPEVRGIDVIVKIDIASTPTALAGEVSARLKIEPETFQAANKSTGAWASRGVGVKTWSVELQAQKDDSSNPVLDEIMSKLTAGTLLTDVAFIEPSGLKTYEGDAYVGPWEGNASASEFYDINVTLLGTGALTITTTS